MLELVYRMLMAGVKIGITTVRFLIVASSPSVGLDDHHQDQSLWKHYGDGLIVII